uniref:Chaperone protein DnaK, molecular chaperone DnaK n=1 Tax=uncultured Parcubacteria bacterium Rifle_16ft_4_minimus_37647 TaxID=1665140 RepID=A0A0H4T451_9BACT|nr:chaperone protein DnaK, molecular chaperone DnaK [uncultured Parcubacteria bacterium Rifle_16ft_4_minimus_37647]
MGRVIGIDLGTTNSAVAVVEGGEPRILENAEGNRTTPSVVATSKSGERLVGLVAKRQAITNPQNTISSVKRLIGRKFSDPEVGHDKDWLPYEIREAADGGVEIKMGDSSTGSGQEKWHKPEEISAMVLGKLKADAEARLGESVEEAVITVPAYFDDSQRQATKNAGEIAGLKVLRIINEPTAAALAYGLDKEKNEQIVVYDFGGGTFDISVLEVGDNTVEVKATGGDTHLGGDDFDKKIIEYLVAEYKKQEGIDIAKDPLALQRLKEGVERAKHELSTSTETEVNLPYISSDASGPKHFLMKLTRAKINELTEDLVERSMKLVKDTVGEAGLKMSDIDEIILVGGQTRMPAIQEGVKKLFGKDPHLGINPDEVVAIGAAAQAGILQGDIKDVLLSQPSVEVHVLQGEREMAQDNKTLARFILDGLPPAPRGIPQIEVTFDIDANGILNVKALDKATNKSQSVKVEASTALSKDEIERLKRDAETHAGEDKKKRELIDTKNHSEALVYTAEKSLRDAGDKVPAEIKKDIEEKIESVKKVSGGDDKSAIESATSALSQSLQKIGELLYKEKGTDNNDDKNDSGEKTGD